MIIGDSSALITFAIIDKLELLEEIFGKLYIPQAVYEEVTQIEKNHSEKLKLFLHNKVKKVDLKLTKLGLGLGELEAITLYKELNANLLLIDDNRAKKFAILNDIQVIGSLGVLIKAKEKGFLKEIKPLLDEIEKSQIYISKELNIKF